MLDLLVYLPSAGSHMPATVDVFNSLEEVRDEVGGKRRGGEIKQAARDETK